MLPLLLLCILISVYSPADVCGHAVAAEEPQEMEVPPETFTKSQEEGNPRGDVRRRRRLVRNRELEPGKSQEKWRSNAPQNSAPKYQEPKSKGAVRGREKAPPNKRGHREDAERIRKRNHGALYILKSEDEVQLECNRSFKSNQQAVWYQTRHQHTYQLEIMNKTTKCVSNKIQVPDSGVFACHSSKGTDFCSTAPSSVNIGAICEYDFFIVTKRREAQRTHEEERESTPDSSDELKKPGRTNITLSCNFTTDGFPFILYWIRAAGQPQCLYSVAGVDQEQPFLFNEHCCVHEGPSPRIYNHSDKHISAKIQKHNIEIRNATSSDSGHYLCIGARLIQETYQWEIVRNISLHVEKKKGTKGNHEGSLGIDSWKLVLIAIGSVALICGLIVCLILLMRNKCKGKEVTGSSSSRNTDHPGTFENDECSPYAVGMKDKDDSAPEPYYTTVKTPHAPEYSLLEASTVTAPKSKTETSTVYALAQM